MKFTRNLAILFFFLLTIFAMFLPNTKGEPARVTLVSANVAVVFWAWGCRELLRQSGDRRRIWLFGSLAMILHIAIAMAWEHDWSHQRALRHTQATAGVAEGLYVNYLFAIVWLGDAIWLVLQPASYAQRHRLWPWWIHGFLAFIVFNATVIYGTPPSRLLGGVLFLGLGWLLLSRWLQRKKSATRTSKPGKMSGNDSTPSAASNTTASDNR